MSFNNSSEIPLVVLTLELFADDSPGISNLDITSGHSYCMILPAYRIDQQ